MYVHYNLHYLNLKADVKSALRFSIYCHCKVSVLCGGYAIVCSFGFYRYNVQFRHEKVFAIA